MNDILITNGFKFLVDFNISCKEWEILRSSSWLTDNVINRSIALLPERIKSTDQNYWILNTYTMSYLLCFPHEKDSLGSRLYKKLPKNIFKYDRLYCICNVGNMHWTVLTVNFQKKSIK